MRKILQVFSPVNSFGGRPLKFWTRIIIVNTILIMVQNFAAINWESSEISCHEEKKCQ